MKKAFFIIISLIGIFTLFILFFLWRLSTENQEGNTVQRDFLTIGKEATQRIKQESIDFLGIGDAPILEKSFLNDASTNNASENVYMVMIDNHHYARTYHAGLSSARILIEAPAEGGIPRIAAIFSASDNLEKIGPVRSARDYFLSFVEAFSPLVAHAGGSPLAMEALYSNQDFLDMDHASHDDQYWREDNILKPHNLFTNSENMVNFMTTENWDKPMQEPAFTYSDIFSPAESVQKMEVVFGFDYNNAFWSWDAEKGAFLRAQDNETEEIYADDVIVLITDQWPAPSDDKARIAVKTTGDGVAYIFRDGQYRKVNWYRDDGDFVKFMDENGEDVGLKPGKIFFELIDGEDKLKITQ